MVVIAFFFLILLRKHCPELGNRLQTGPDCPELRTFLGLSSAHSKQSHTGRTFVTVVWKAKSRNSRCILILGPHSFFFLHRVDRRGALKMMVREQIQADSHLCLGHTDDDEQNIDFHFVSVFPYVNQAAVSVWSELGTSVSLYSMDTICPFS